MTPEPSRTRRLPIWLARWFDSWASDGQTPIPGEVAVVNWLRCVPFVLIHLSCLGVIWVGWSPFAVLFAIAFYFVRMFAITAFYHRYFSHRSFRTSRAFQFAGALLAGTAVQRGPLWWAAHHREHHRFADGDQDPHSPSRRGFWWSHLGWFTAEANFATRLDRIRDFARFPELCLLDRFDAVVPVACGVIVFGTGALLGAVAPGLGTSGPQLLVWGLISTVVLHHMTFTINSLAHVIGTRPYATADTSRNNLLLAVVTLGEGWHNNHHHYPASVRQGFRWWQIDVCWYVLLLLEKLGLVWDLRPVPAHVIDATRQRAA